MKGRSAKEWPIYRKPYPLSRFSCVKNASFTISIFLNIPNFRPESLLDFRDCFDMIPATCDIREFQTLFFEGPGCTHPSLPGEAQVNERRRKGHEKAPKEDPFGISAEDCAPGDPDRPRPLLLRRPLPPLHGVEGAGSPDRLPGGNAVGRRDRHRDHRRKEPERTGTMA